MSSGKQEPGCTGCALVLAIGASAVFFGLLRWLDVPIRSWMFVADGIIFGLVMAAAHLADSSGKGTKDGSSPAAGEEAKGEGKSLGESKG